MKRSVDVVVLDMGGVILDMGPAGGLPFDEFEREGRRALGTVLEPNGLSIADADRLLFDPWRAGHAIRRERGREEGLPQHLARLGAAAKLGSRALVEVWFRAYGAWLSPLPGAVAAVHELAARGLRLGIVSNVPLPGFLYRTVLDRLGVGGCFLDTRFSHDEGSRKPATLMLERCLTALGAEPQQAVMVGDRKHEDVGSGRALGCATVWLASGYDRGPEPDGVVADLAGLPALLENWEQV